MSWKDHMQVAAQATVTDYDGEDYTRLTFRPDLSLFKCKTISSDMLSLFKKRAYDLAGILDKKVAVTLNGQRIKIQSFLEYTDLYELEGDNHPRTHEIVSSRWEVVATVSEGQFMQASFVNGICTGRGGTHVNLVADQITEKLAEHIKKKNKDLNLKPFQIKNNLAVFVNCLIENPAFDSQTKETLMTRTEDFGSECVLSEKFIKDILKSGVVDFIVSQARAKERVKVQKALSGKKSQRVLGIPKLEDANLAGSKDSRHCQLILTEGDSAKALAMAGLGVVGRDKFGVFPLKGKLLNVRDANAKTLKENVEIQAIVKILGLQFDRVYEDTDSLRYGGILIMADQDHDGSHIKGLIINFIHYFWPSLIKINSFLKEFVTPVIKAIKQGEDPISFFTINDYKQWSQNMLLEHPEKRYSIKYYKGLGTSTDKEARAYFSEISKHVITFKHSNKTDDELIDLAFAKSKADERKKWIESCRLEETVDHSIKSLTYTEFINKELVQYSVASNARAIPSVIDGLKPGQRKIVFASFKRSLKGEIKVAQLAGYVAEHSAYHHGETSLVGTIINLAQDYIGSNNIPLLLPLGQFGTRAMGGKDAASARYIFTKLSPLTRLLFPESDDGVLNYLEDDGMRVEPEYYVPILPLVLLNGCAGIGMGWSTFIPSYNPMDLIENVKRLLDDKPLEKMTPWYFGFRGSITSDSSQTSSIVITGSYKELNSDTLEITELPIGTWTGDYKEFLESMMTGDKDSQKIAEVKEYHSRGAIHFIIKFREGVLRTLKEDLVKKLRLTSNISLKNMVLFNKEGNLTRYDSPEQILTEFFGVRLRFYTLRKESLIRALEAELRVLSNRVKFINLILENRLELKDRQRTIIEEDMLRLGLEKLGGKNTVTEDAAEEEEGDSGNSFNYLLNMKLSTLTKEKVELLRKSEQEKLDELQRLRETTEKTMWLRDLAKFEEIYNSDVSRRMLECYGKDTFERMKQSVGTVAPGKKSSLTKAEVAPKSNGHSKQNGTKKSAKRSSPEDSEHRSQSESSEEKKPKVKKAEKVLVKRSSKPINSDEKRTSSNGKKSIKSASSKKKAAKAKPVRKRKEASESEDDESEDERSLSDEGEYSDSQYGSDSPPKRQKKIVKRKQKNDSEDLDDSDLELIVKNTKKSKPAPTRRRKPSEDDEEMSEEKKPNKEKSNSKSSSKPKKRKIMLSDDEESEEKAPKPKKRARIMADSDDSEYNG